MSEQEIKPFIIEFKEPKGGPWDNDLTNRSRVATFIDAYGDWCEVGAFTKPCGTRVVVLGSTPTQVCDCCDSEAGGLQLDRQMAKSVVELLQRFVETGDVATECTNDRHRQAE